MCPPHPVPDARHRDRPLSRQSWVAASLFVAVLAATLVAVSLGMRSEYGWLWGEERRAAALFVGVGLVELGLLGWWARTRGHPPVPFLIGGILVLILLAFGPYSMMIGVIVVAVGIRIRDVARRVIARHENAGR